MKQIFIDSILKIFEFRGLSGPSVFPINADYSLYERCPACGRVISVVNKRGLKCEITGSGSSWPDILSGGTVLHERVIEALRLNHFSGYKAHEIEIVKITGKKLANNKPPKYFWLEITGAFDVVLEELDDVGGSVCPICFYRNTTPDNKYRFFPKRIIPKKDGLDKFDFFTSRNLRNAVTFCSRRFVDLASQNKWTNFIFGESLPGIVLREKVFNGNASYLDQNWFEFVENKVRENYSDLH